MLVLAEDGWINQRMTGQETRNKLTEYWAGHEVEKGQDMAILTIIIHQEWTGIVWRRTSR